MPICDKLAHELYHNRKDFFEGYTLAGPTITFGFIIATLFGAGFHLLLGGDARRLAAFLLSGWLGFVLGHLIGAALNIEIMSVGTLYLFPAALGSCLALLFAQGVTRSKPRRMKR